jgi:hypothetical protein
MTEDGAPQAPRKQIIITFQDGCNIRGEGVQQSDIYLAAWMMEAWAREVRADEVKQMQAHSKQLLVPHASPAARALGREQ